MRALVRRIGAAAIAAFVACAAHAQLGIGGPILGSTPVNWASPGPIGSTTPNSGVFTTLTAQTSFTLGSSADIFLVRDAAAGIVAQRNGTNGQCFRVYNTFTDASNYERAEFCWAANLFTLQTAAAGTGTTRALNLNAPNGKLVNLQVNNVTIASVGANGIFVNSAAVANQPRFIQTTAPTCATNCGTSPTLTGSDAAFRLVMGATGVPASGFVITFNGTWPTAAPVCFAQMALAGMVVGKMPLTVVPTTTTITVVTNGTAPANNDVYSFHCIGVA